MKGYIYAELTVTDEAKFYDEYMPAVRPVLAGWDATFLVAGGDPEVLEGGRDVRRIVFIEFESRARAEEFYHSKAYQDIIGLRFDSATTHLYMLSGTEEA